MAFCLLLERLVLARPRLSFGRSTGWSLSRHRLWQRINLAPSRRARRTSDRVRFLRKPYREGQGPFHRLSVANYLSRYRCNKRATIAFPGRPTLSNMALFDMADIETLFRILPRLLKAYGTFVFSLMHLTFNNASSTHVMEEIDDEGEIKILYSVKVSRYMTPYN